ncbi:MAG: DnaA ATPase domain-containing protein [Phycisphaerales bacterium]
MATPHAAISSRSVSPTQEPHGSSDLHKVCERLREELGHERFERYFDGGDALRLEDRALRVRVSSPVVAGLLDRRFKDSLRDAARHHTGQADLQVHFEIDTHAVAQAAAVTAARASAPAAKARPVPPPVARHRLEQFVAGTCNRLALEAVRRIADTTAASTHSTLFLHGPCGTGKTHLLVGAVAWAQAQGRSARYVTAEALANEFIGAVRNKRVETFRRAYRGLDLICIDDVQALGNKPATQTELQHTLDAIIRRGGRVALAGPVHPRLERSLNEALSSRLLAGMVAGVQLPDAETTRHIVRSLCAVRGLSIDGAAEMAILAKARDLSVRELEGLVTKVEAVHRLLGHSSRAGGDPRNAASIGMLAVARALHDGSQGGPGVAGPGMAVQRPVRADEIIARVCEHLDVQSDELRGNGRHPRVVLSRALITHLCRQLTTMSYPEIARAIGRPNHSTVITAHQRLARQMGEKLVVDLGPQRGSIALTELAAGLSQQIAPRPASSTPIAAVS